MGNMTYKVHAVRFLKNETREFSVEDSVFVCFVVSLIPGRNCIIAH